MTPSPSDYAAACAAYWRRIQVADRLNTLSAPIVAWLTARSVQTASGTTRSIIDEMDRHLTAHGYMRAA